MSDYPVWWDTTITIYNKHEDPQTRVVSWYRHSIDACFWKYTGSEIKISNVVLKTDDIICRIPEQEGFLEKYLWEQVSNDEKGNYFTLGVGDIIIRGAVEDEIDEYQSGHRSTDIVKKYKNLQGCLEIHDAAINVGVGRNNPHYYVRGF